METMTSWEEKSMEKEWQTIALNLLRPAISLEAIAQATGLSQLQEMQAKLSGRIGRS